MIYEKDVKQIEEFLENGRMNSDLREALEAIKKALEEDDRELASKLSSVKSFIIHKIDDDIPRAFQEDPDYNKEEIGVSIYTYLDGFRFRISRSIDEIPEGSLEFEDIEKDRDIKKDDNEHPVVKKMHKELKKIREEL